jgi:hypothetical protein
MEQGHSHTASTSSSQSGWVVAEVHEAIHENGSRSPSPAESTPAIQVSSSTRIDAPETEPPRAESPPDYLDREYLLRSPPPLHHAPTYKSVASVALPPYTRKENKYAKLTDLEANSLKAKKWKRWTNGKVWLASVAALVLITIGIIVLMKVGNKGQ